jgi:Mannosyl-glycoprotein endo-beta-N-acetylglucosaminidase
MSADSPARRRKISERANQAGRRAPMFEVRHEPLPEKPTPLQTTRDPFEDLPEGRPRAMRAPAQLGRADAAGPRLPMPIERKPRPDLVLREPADAPAEPEPKTMPKRMIGLRQADALAGRLGDRAPVYHPYAAPPDSPVDFVRGRLWLLVLVAAVSLIVYWFAASTPKTIISGFTGAGPIAASNAISKVFGMHNVPEGQHAVIGQPTITAQFIDRVLAHYGSPAQGTGKIWVEMGQQYGIDPAYALAFFIHESGAGTNSGWAGIKPGGGSTHNVGNIICAGYATCFGHFRDYDSWQAGIEDWYKLIATEYVDDRGTVTVEQIIPIYAPAFENDVNNYVQTVIGLADSWRQGVIR